MCLWNVFLLFKESRLSGTQRTGGLIHAFLLVLCCGSDFKVESCKCFLWVRYLGLQWRFIYSVWTHTPPLYIKKSLSVQQKDFQALCVIIYSMCPSRTRHSVQSNKKTLKAVIPKIPSNFRGNCCHKIFKNTDKTSAKVFRWLITWIISHMLCFFFSSWQL